jgi:hypothetical protein
MNRVILRHALLSICCVLLLAGGTRAAHGQEVLTNDHIITLTRASVDPVVVVSTIEGSTTRFIVNIDGIVALSDARVHRDVIAAMQAAVARGGRPKAGMAPIQPSSVPLPAESGLYVTQGGQPSRLPLVAMSPDTSGRFTRRVRAVRIQDFNVIEAKRVAEVEPRFVLFHQSAAQSPRVQLFHMTKSVLDLAFLEGEVPLVAGAAGPDSRMVSLVPGIPLDRGFYAFVVDGDFSRAYGFGRVAGQRNPPSLNAVTGAARVRTSPALQTALSLDSAKSLVISVLARERLPVEQDFDVNGLLITARGLRGGLFGSSVAVQFVVRVRPAVGGSEIQVTADAYTLGYPSGTLTAENLAELPLLASPEQSRRHAESLEKDIQRAVRRAR